MYENSLLIEIVKAILVSKETEEIIDIKNWNSLIQSAQKRGLSFILYQYMTKLPEPKKPDLDTQTLLKHHYLSELKIGILQKNAIEKMTEPFEKSHVDNLFIKGTVTKSRDPNEFYRSMGDMDFLYRPTQDSILRTTMESIGFQIKTQGRVHDIYFNDSSVCSEAHRQLLASSSPYISFYDGIWDRIILKNNCNYCYMMTVEDEIIFNIIHLASHFKKGGIGIRFIMDVWVYSKIDADWNCINQELEKLKLYHFYKNIIALANKWFDSIQTEDPIVEAMEEYILSNRLFGDCDTRNSAVLTEGKLHYVKKTLFPSFEEMKSMYPWLEQKFLLPYAWAKRGIESSLYRRSNIISTMNPLLHGNEFKAQELKRFFQVCGL